MAEQAAKAAVKRVKVKLIAPHTHRGTDYDKGAEI